MVVKYPGQYVGKDGKWITIEAIGRDNHNKLVAIWYDGEVTRSGLLRRRACLLSELKSRIVRPAEEQREDLDDEGLLHYNEPHSIVGRSISRQDSDTYMLKEAEVSLAELNEMAKELAERFGKDIAEIKLLTGTAPS